MNHDPLFNAILERLRRDVDGNLFERCAQDLLRQVYPNLVPVVGGGDGGMDGALGTSEGVFPLICTASDDVTGNVRHNLESFFSGRAGPRRVVVATSRPLTTTRRQNVEAVVSEFDAVLVNLHDGHDFTGRLYRNSRWRLELLGLAGNPPALSAYPSGARHRINSNANLVGRETEIAWIRARAGDALVVGQPGSGKTCLHQVLSEQSHALFAVSDDETHLANAIREQQPTIVVVDDAHTDPGMLNKLLALRARLGFQFKIHANCWPSFESSVKRALSLPESEVLTVELLTRAQILEVVKHSGVHGPDWLLHTIIQQADGKAGLASAITETCKRDGVERVWDGTALVTQLMGDTRIVRDERERVALAAFSVGGDAGLPFSQVAEKLEMSPIELRAVVTNLGAGGVVEETTGDRIQVRPPGLRPLLIRDVFYAGPGRLSIDGLVEISPVVESANVLMSCRQRGGNVPHQLIRALVERENTDDLWEHLAWVDDALAEYLLDQHPSKVFAATPGLLYHLPVRTIREMLRRHATGESPQDGSGSNFRQRIEDWLFDIDFAEGELLRRRKVLTEALEEAVRDDDVTQIGVSVTIAIAELMSFHFYHMRQSPGETLSYTHTRGVIEPVDMQGLIDLWPRVRVLLSSLPRTAFQPILSFVEDWCFPGRRLMGSDSTATTTLATEHAMTMLNDVLALPQASAAWSSWAHWNAKHAELDIHIQVDPFFHTLFRGREHIADWEREQRERVAELSELADRLDELPREDAIAKLHVAETLAKEAEKSPGGHERWIAYDRLAKKVSEPEVWALRLVELEFLPILVEPFLAAVAKWPDRFEALVPVLLARNLYRKMTVFYTISLEAVPTSLRLAVVEAMPEPERGQGYWNRVPDIEMMRGLLQHRNPRIRGGWANAEWHSQSSSRQVRVELFDVWREAVIAATHSSHEFEEIFAKYPDIAKEWVLSVFQDREQPYLSDTGMLMATKALTRDQRRELLMAMPPRSYWDKHFDILVGEDVDLFVDWLRRSDLSYRRLLPLQRAPDARFQSLAIVALNEGVSPSDVALHARPRSWGGMGRTSVHLAKLLDGYTALTVHEDSRLHLAGRQGVTWVTEELERVRRKERLEDIRGRG